MEPAEHARKRPPLEMLLSTIPGFQGYLDRENRRASDRIQRQWIAERLDHAKRRLSTAGRALADAGRLEAIVTLDRLRGSLDKLIARIRGAVHGYSGFFDLVQVDKRMLDRIYEHDAELSLEAEELADALEKLSGQVDAILGALPDMEQRVESLKLAWDKREAILEGAA
jgi:hypothetical protein